MENATRGGVSIESAIRDPAFIRGYEDAVSGRPFRYDFPRCNMAAQSMYESGRIFGQVYQGPLRRKGRISREAANVMRENLDVF